MDMQMRRILERLDVSPIHDLTPGILGSCIGHIMDALHITDIDNLVSLQAPILSNLDGLSNHEIEMISQLVETDRLSLEECQYRAQKLLDSSMRKRFAAYYTIPIGAEFLARVASEYLKLTNRSQSVLADPFLGTGCALTRAIELIGPEQLGVVWGIEPVSLPALVAYASLLTHCNGNPDKVRIYVGDAFEILSAESDEQFMADLVLTNPPFTRSQHLDRDYRKWLLSIIGDLGYLSYLPRREINLQILSIFLVDHILRSGGLLASVLPVSTFYTLSGRGLKKLLREKYDILAVTDMASRPSFSDDSGFSEVILTAVKDASNVGPTRFFSVQNPMVDAHLVFDRAHADSSVDLRNVPAFLDNNWSVFLHHKDLLHLINDIFFQGLEVGTLKPWHDSLGSDRIIRGVEMYGPEFFFIPNKYWSVLQETDHHVTIQNPLTKSVCSIEQEFLVPALRRPALYDNKMQVDVTTYLLSLPPRAPAEFSEDVRDYLHWGQVSGTAAPAIANYGDYWYAHVHSQIVAKKPFGHLFIPDKVDLHFKTRGVFANFSPFPVAASKNFYIVKHHDLTTVKVLLGWFNSTLFLLIILMLGRRISQTWTRLLENDYLEIPVISARALDETARDNIVYCIDSILSNNLPPYWKQIGGGLRRELDKAVIHALGLRDPDLLIRRLYRGLTDFGN